jgi:type I site-specific restriction-modification system R (restriction) subunit
MWCLWGGCTRPSDASTLPIPDDAREEALRKLLRLATPSLLQTNRAFHRLLREGVPVEYPRPDGSIAGDNVRLVDFAAVAANDWLVLISMSGFSSTRSRPTPWCT